MYSEEANEYGLYGSNQGSLINNNIGYILDKVIKSIIEKYYPLSQNKIEYEPERLINVFKKTNEIGCGYVTAANTIFNATEDLDKNGKLDDIMESNVGNHAMVVTEIIENGDFVVSSWGNKYIIRPQTEGFLQESVIYYK